MSAPERVCLYHLIPAPRVGKSGHEWLFQDYPDVLLDAFADDLIADVAASRAEPFLCGDLLAVRTEHHRRQQ